jgi:hypothetical protein
MCLPILGAGRHIMVFLSRGALQFRLGYGMSAGGFPDSLQCPQLAQPCVPSNCKCLGNLWATSSPHAIVVCWCVMLPLGLALSMLQRYRKCVVRLAYLYNMCSHVLADTVYELHVLLHRKIDQAQVLLSTNATTNTQVQLVRLRGWVLLSGAAPTYAALGLSYVQLIVLGL